MDPYRTQAGMADSYASRTHDDDESSDLMDTSSEQEEPVAPAPAPVPAPAPAQAVAPGAAPTPAPTAAPAAALAPGIAPAAAPGLAAAAAPGLATAAAPAAAPAPGAGGPAAMAAGPGAASVDPATAAAAAADNGYVCAKCHKEGEVLVCECCPKVYHATCLSPPLNTVPEEHWRCNDCEARQACAACRKDGAERQCVSCMRAFHETCLAWKGPEPPVTWICPNCQEQAGINKVLSARLPAEGMKQYLVLWNGRSHRQLSWVDKNLMDMLNAVKVRNYDRAQPYTMTVGEDYVDDLEYHGVSNASLEPHRVLEAKWRHLDGIRPKRFLLVKWRGCSYMDATWEAEEELAGEQPGGSGEAIVSDYNWRCVRYKGRPLAPTRLLESMGSPGRKGRVGFRPYESDPPFIPSGLKLHDYQLEGVNWLRHAWWSDRSVILADEMGLGKTVQSAMFVRSILEEQTFRAKRYKGHILPVLVVAPLSTLENWEREFGLWTPELNVILYVGDKASRARIAEVEMKWPDRRHAEGSAEAHSAARPDATESNMKWPFHVFLTSYELAKGDAKVLRRVEWESMVVDEGHRLKSGAAGKLFQELLTFDVRHKVLLTGTPLQNSMEELFNLLGFLDKSKFEKFESLFGGLEDLEQSDAINRLKEQLIPHMLRRQKRDVNLGMPSKEELIVRVEMAPAQKSLYRDVLTKNFEKLRGRGRATSSLMNVLVQLQKVCNHPDLFLPPSDLPATDAEAEAALKKLIESSGKLQLLDRMLEKLKRDGHRVLIFSQMTSMLDVLEIYLQGKAARAAGGGWGYCRLDGNTRSAMRQTIIDRFNNAREETFVFLLSTRAGGVGINLATADTVVIYDTDWNPHNDLQALSRAHRIGQKNKVMIYRFVVRGSMEERKIERTRQKMLLEHVVVRGTMRSNTMSQQELDDVLKYGTEELFREEQEMLEGGGEAKEGAETDKEKDAGGAKAIVWSDEAVAQLLDRSKEEEAPQEADGEGQPENLASGLLQSFKVAKFSFAEGAEGAEGESDAEPEEEEPENALDDPSFVTDKTWEELIGKRAEQVVAEQAALLGRGKRERQQVVHYNVDHQDAAFEDDLWGRGNGAAPSKKRRTEFGDNHRVALMRVLNRLGLVNADWEKFFSECYDTSGPLKARTRSELLRGAWEMIHSGVEQFFRGGKAPQGEDGETNEHVEFRGFLKRLGLLELCQKKVDELKAEGATKLSVRDDGIADVERRDALCKGSGRWGPEEDMRVLLGMMKFGHTRWDRILTDGMMAPVVSSAILTQKEEERMKPRRLQGKLSQFIRARVDRMEKALVAEHMFERLRAGKSVGIVVDKIMDDWASKSHHKVLLRSQRALLRQAQIAQFMRGILKSQEALTRTLKNSSEDKAAASAADAPPAPALAVAAAGVVGTNAPGGDAKATIADGGDGSAQSLQGSYEAFQWTQSKLGLSEKKIQLQETLDAQVQCLRATAKLQETCKLVGSAAVPLQMSNSEAWLGGSFHSGFQSGVESLSDLVSRMKEEAAEVQRREGTLDERFRALFEVTEKDTEESSRFAVDVISTRMKQQDERLEEAANKWILGKRQELRRKMEAEEVKAMQERAKEQAQAQARELADAPTGAQDSLQGLPQPPAEGPAPHGAPAPPAEEGESSGSDLMDDSDEEEEAGADHL